MQVNSNARWKMTALMDAWQRKKHKESNDQNDGESKIDETMLKRMSMGNKHNIIKI